MKKILQFVKVEHTIFSIPLLFTGAWLGAGQTMPPLGVLGLVVLAGVGARMLGMSMNRIFDRKIDARNPRTKGRELPSGKMSVLTASTIALVGLSLYLIACWLLGPLILKLSPIPAIVLIGYSLLKRFTPLCHFGIGLTLGLAPIGAYVATRGDVTPSYSIGLLFVFAFCWISGFDIIYALQDIDSDRKNGIYSIPAALGALPAQWIAGVVHAVAIGALVGLLFVTGSGPAGYAALSIAFVAFVAAYLPFFPLPYRFFPISAIAGVSGAIVPIVGAGLF